MYGQINYRLDIWPCCLPYIYRGHFSVCFQSDAVIRNVAKDTFFLGNQEPLLIRF